MAPVEPAFVEALGDVGASHTDPYAREPAPNNDWVVTGPHVMLLPADPSRIAAVQTDYRTGGPYQMWKGTPTPTS